MQLYNTLTRRVEAFSSRAKTVGVYACGITPYDATHLGHAFTYAALDVLIRYIEYNGQRVRYVQNVTDVDDDILRKAREVREDWRRLGDRWTARFIRDMTDLNVRPPDVFPRATDVIPEIIDVVDSLIKAGVAYESGGSVYFHIDAWPEYGKLSGLSRDEMLPIASERGNNPDDVNKRDPLDFVLWQAEAPGEPSWESPWGRGRPGWHIECSTMAVRFLGACIDIHSGGSDLIFPHHESEIAQTEAATGETPFVRHWLHMAMVRHQGEKMSKSLGNLVMIDDLLNDWSPDALRVYLALHHYRDPWDHDERELIRASDIAERLKSAVSVQGGNTKPLAVSDLEAAFVNAMDDDLNSPRALHHLEGLASAILGAAGRGRSILDAQTALRSLGRIFGLRLDADRPENRVTCGWHEFLEQFV